MISFATLSTLLEWLMPLLASAAVLGLGLRIWRTIDEDRPTPMEVYRNGWWIQHDEKHMVHEGRVLAFRPKEEINDYYWPVILAFGVVPSYVAAWGFRFGGTTLKALRRPYFFLNTLSILFYGLAISLAAPWWIALPFLIIFLINLETLTVWRYALPESFLYLYCAVTTFLLVADPQLTWTLLPIITGAAGLLAAVKISFPVIAGLYPAGIFLSQSLHMTAIEWGWGLLCAGSLLCVWALTEGGQFLVYRALGVPWKYRWINLSRSLAQHTNDISASRTEIRPHEPARWNVFVDFPYFSLKLTYPFLPHIQIIGFFFLLVVFLGFGAGQAGTSGQAVSLAAMAQSGGFVLANPALWAILFYMLIHQALHWPVLWYSKRGMHLYYPLVVMSTLLVGQVMAVVQTLFDGVIFGLAAVVLVGLPLSGFYFWQRLAVRMARSHRSTAVQDNLTQLELWVPDNAIIYADCFSARFLWPKHVRILSSDVVTWTQQDVLDWAELHDGSYVLLSSLAEVQVDQRVWRIALDLSYDGMAASEYLTVVLLERRRPLFTDAPACPFKGEYVMLDAYRAARSAGADIESAKAAAAAAEAAR